MTVELPSPPAYPPPPAGPPPTARRRRRVPLIVAAAIVVLAAGGGVAVAAVRHGSSSRPTSPQAVTDAYYAALRRPDAARAYDLLCTQQRQGAAAFASEVADDERTGTGIRTWTREGGADVRGDEAVVAGRLVLDDGTATPIHLLLVRQSGRWGVCTSDLGGILPGTGTGNGSTGSGGTQT